MNAHKRMILGFVMAYIAILLLASCSDKTQEAAAAPRPETITLTGFDIAPNGDDPNGIYTRIRVEAAPGFTKSFIDDRGSYVNGPAPVEPYKPVYQKGIWYVWASDSVPTYSTGRYIISRQDTADLWFLENPATTSQTDDTKAGSPKEVTAWYKAAGTATTPAPTAGEIKSDSSKATLVSGALVQ